MKLIKAEVEGVVPVDSVIDFMLLNGAALWTIRIGAVTDRGRRYLIGQSALDPDVELMVTYRPLES